MKSIFCPHCGKLFTDIMEELKSLELNHVMLDGDGTLCSDYYDTIYEDDIMYYCGECNNDLIGYEYDDIVAIYKKIDEAETKYKEETKKTLYDNEDDFNKWLKENKYE